MVDLWVEPSPSFGGQTSVPGDKSISHRALLLGAIGENTIEITGFLESEDCLATLNALKMLGVNIHRENDRVLLHGVGLKGLTPSPGPLNCGNAGTLMRLLAGLLAGQAFESILFGDESLNNRPMERIIDPLSRMGASIKGYPPLHIVGGPLHGIEYQLPIASAQVKSCIMLAGLFAKTPTTIIEFEKTRDHTERMLLNWGYPLKIADKRITLTPDQALHSQNIAIPGDFSSAAFLIGGACMLPKSHLLIKNVGINPTRTGMIAILREMGADIHLTPSIAQGDEPVADIEVKGQALKGIVVPAKLVASTIDEFPILFIVAACAKGETRFSALSELRVKESDRLTTMAKGLASLGVSVEIFENDICIQGSAIGGGEVESLGDHRIAMAFAMAGLVAKDPIKIKDCDNIKTSFPHFCETMQNLGLRIRELV